MSNFGERFHEHEVVSQEIEHIEHMATNKQLDENTIDVTQNGRMPTHRVNENIELNSFQVARKEYCVGEKFAANITININKIQFNAACIRFYPDTNYIEILIDPARKRLAIRPCSEYDRDAYKWARNQIKDNKRISRQISMTDAWEIFFRMMNWNPENKYKVFGTRKIYNNADMVLFLLEEAVEYTVEKEIQPDGQVRTKRNAFLPPKWRDSFGDYVDVHDSKMEIAAEETIKLFNTPDGTAYILNPKRGNNRSN